MKVPIEISARHVHICKEDLEILFGKNYILRKKKILSQKAQFACQQTVTLFTDKFQIPQVRVVGPVWSYTQAEISLSDAYYLDIQPPLRECVTPITGKKSDKNQRALINIRGPKGEITSHAAVIARRHLHCDPVTAKKFGLRNNQNISIRVSGQRSIIFNQVWVRIKPEYTLMLHLDTDEANAANVKNEDMGEIL